jgi:hypothetical protein
MFKTDKDDFLNKLIIKIDNYSERRDSELCLYIELISHYIIDDRDVDITVAFGSIIVSDL